MQATLTEHELIKRSLNNDGNCQRMLFEQHAGKMMTICLRYSNDQMEAEDLLMEGFVKVFHYLHQFKFEGSFEGWIRRIIVNTALKNLQKKKIHFEEVKEDNGIPILDAGAYQHLGEKEILNLIRKLPQGYKIVFNLYAIEGYSHDEIAEMLGIHAGTSRSQLVKARKLLQQQMAMLHKTVAV